MQYSLNSIYLSLSLSNLPIVIRHLQFLISPLDKVQRMESKGRSVISKSAILPEISLNLMSEITEVFHSQVLLFIMTKLTPDTLDIAQQENAQALATLMNRWLKPRGMAATATREENCLHVTFTANQVPNLKVLITFIRKVLFNLGVVSIKTVKISVYLPGQISPVCYEEIDLKPQAKLPQNWGGSITPAAKGEIPESTANGNQSAGALTNVQSPSWLDTKQGKMLVILPVFMVAVAILWFNFNQKQPLPTQSPPTPATSSPAANFFQQAVNQAIRASKQAQTAKTQQEWKSIAAQWQEAKTLMQAVPVSHPKYELAQQKVKEYQRKLEYAQQKAKTSP